MKKGLIICLTFICTLSFGQSVKWGAPAEFSGSNFFDTHRYSCIQVDTNGFYFLHQKNNEEYSVEKFDLTLRKEKVSELKKLPLYRELSKEIEYVFNLNEKTYAISVAKDHYNSIYYYFLEKFNTEKLQFEEEKKLYTFRSRNSEIEVFSIGFRISPNQKKLLIAKTAYKRNQNERKYFFAVYDENLELEWDEIVKVRRESMTEYILFNDFVISNAGNVYMHNRISIARIKYPSWKNKIVAVFNKGKENKIYDLAIKDGFSSVDCKMFITDNNNLTISGFYTDKVRSVKDELVGSYHLVLNTKSREIEVETYNPFTTKNYKFVLNDRSYNKRLSLKKDSYTMPEGFIYSWMSTADGTIYHVVRLFRKGHKIRGIGIYKISSKGILEWIRQIPIHGTTNIGCQLVDNELYVVYNDHVDNENLGVNQFPKKIIGKGVSKNGSLVLVTLDEIGNSKREIVSRYEDAGGKVERFYSFQRDINFMLLYGENDRKKELYLGAVKLD